MSSIIDIDYHNRDFQPRARVLIVIISLAFLSLGVRLWYLQVVRGDDYSSYAARNSFKAREIPAPRGIIFDSRGNRIADVRPSFDVVIRPDRILSRRYAPDPNSPEDRMTIEALSQRLSHYLGMAPAAIEEKYHAATGRARFKPIPIKTDVTRDEIAVLEAHRIELPGVDIQVSQKRTYPYDALFSHLVGYMGEVRRDELIKLREKFKDSLGEDYYEIGDFIGRYGIEKHYESYLKGQDGVSYVQEDASGRVVNAFDHDQADDVEFARSMLAYLSKRRQPEIAGHDLILTVDLELQSFVREQMRSKIGSAIVMEAETGKILAMVNSPSYDPEIFARGISQTDWELLRDDPAHPLEDKSLRGQYPPGSTYKMIPAAAALAERVITPDTTFFCPGSLKVGGRKFRCHKSSGHGFVNVHNAIVASCDVFFYQVGTRLGIDRLSTYSRAFGLGKATGLELNQEKSGLVPSAEWKLKVLHQPWVLGDTVSASIGQGFNLVTPVQLARMTAAIANSGRLVRPYVVDRIQDVEGTTILQTQPESVGELPVSKAHLRLIQSGMLGVVEQEGGTGRVCRIRGLHIAGKTGTAQVVRQEFNDLGKKLKPIHEDHAWFTAYAPFDKPEIVVSVLVEHGGHGGSVAAPIARSIFQNYFESRGKLRSAKVDSPTPAVIVEQDFDLPPSADHGADED